MRASQRAHGGGTRPAGPESRPESGCVLGVLGGSGGVGASALATACAVRAAAAGRDVVLVDGNPWGGGLDVMAGLDVEPGLRWADLGGVLGDVDETRLLDALPVGQARVRCLSWGADPPDSIALGPEPVLSALRRAAGLVVLDLPRPGAGPAHRPWWEWCDELVLVVEASVVGIGSATVTAAQARRLTGAVLRSPSVLEETELQSAVGAPVLARLADDSTVRRCLERGDPVGTQPGPLSDAADEVLAAVLPGLRAA